jgi:acetolactate synthase-1/2/3 large subunit
MQESPGNAYVDEVARRAREAHTPGTAPDASGIASTWVEVPADNVGEALLQSWWVNGIDHVMFTSGSDIAWFQEATTKLRALGRPTPQLVTMLHENTSLNAACGYSMVAERPIATAAHVELGTLNYGDAIHTASRGQYPVLITSGKTPSSYGGTRAGDRGQEPIWKQDLWDYGSILRQYVKWDHELSALENPGLTSSRALQVAMSGARGPAYLSIPRDVALSPLDGARFPSAERLCVPSPPAGDPDAIAAAAKALVGASSPWMTSTSLGRDPRAVEAVTALAELLAIPFAETGSDRVNFRSDHPLYGAAPPLAEADVVLVIESLVPWIPHYAEPSPQATIITVGVDPAYTRNLNYEYPADSRITGDPFLVLTQIREAAERLLTRGRREAIAVRAQTLGDVSRQRRRARVEAATAGASATGISSAYAAYAFAQALDEDARVLAAAVSNGADVMDHVPRVRHGSFFRAGSAGGGWASGAAFGAKLADRDAFVALAVGDGFFQFGVPNAALWSAVKYDCPFLVLVFQNNQWTTGTNDVRRQFPDGYCVESGNFEGGTFEPAPDLAKLAQSVGAYAENVSDPALLPATIERAARAVREGTPAVVAAQISA